MDSYLVTIGQPYLLTLKRKVVGWGVKNANLADIESNRVR